jgi:hypothetical protein
MNRHLVEVDGDGGGEGPFLGDKPSRTEKGRRALKKRLSRSDLE